MKIQVGDTVLFTPHKGHAYAGDGRKLKYFGEPLAAIVAHVDDDKGMVNLSVIDAGGRQYAQEEVPLLGAEHALPQQGFYCMSKNDQELLSELASL